MNEPAALARRTLERPSLGVGLALLAMLLCAPSLRLGFVLDDHFIRAALDAPEQMPEAARAPGQVFAWLGEDWRMHPDISPWWASESLRVAFFRPLAGYTHWLDHQLWPEEPMWMHLQSLLWLGLVVFAATWLFRCLARPGEIWIAGLAALVFALDDTHAVPAVWLANRNYSLALFFGILTLIAHHRHRRGGRRLCPLGGIKGGRLWAFAAPAALSLAVLSGEAAVACGAYLVSYALFLDRGPLRQRLTALAPCAGVGVAWLLVYKVLGYGARDSGAYIDPAEQPLRFLDALLERGPVLLWGQFGFPPPEIYNQLSQPAARQAWWVVVVLLIALGLLLVPLLRRDAQARFWAFGLLAALPPSCAMYPGNRLLGYVSLGAAGLLALFVVRAWRRDRTGASGWRPRCGAGRCVS